MQLGRLREAQELYLACARAACGELIRQDCAARHTQLSGDVPSIVPLVTDAAGAPRVLVEVRIDGQLVASRLSGQALLVDPGKHELSFSTDDGVFATRQVFVAQGERNRTIHVVLRAPEATPAAGKLALARKVDEPAPATSKGDRKKSDDDDDDPDDRTNAKLSLAPSPAGAPHLLDGQPAAAVEEHARRDSGSPAGGIVMGALGLAGVGGFALLTSWGRTDNRMLATCSPSCPAASVQHVRRLYWAADASLGVGLASLAVSTWLLAGSF